jgi:hypothetical protein
LPFLSLVVATKVVAEKALAFRGVERGRGEERRMLVIQACKMHFSSILTSRISFKVEFAFSTLLLTLSQSWKHSSGESRGSLTIEVTTIEWPFVYLSEMLASPARSKLIFKPPLESKGVGRLRVERETLTD